MPHPSSVSAVALSSIHPERSLKSSIALTLSVGGSASLTGQVEAHIIPRVELGVSLLRVAQASIYLEVDGYGVLDMHLTGSIAALTSVPIPIGTTTSAAEDSASASTNAYATVVDVDTQKTRLGHDPYSGVISKRDGSSFIYEGCVGLDVGVSVNGGAKGKLFKLLSGDISLEIYGQKWEIFEVSCFLTYLSDGLTMRNTEMLRYACQAALRAEVEWGTLRPPLEPAHLPVRAQSDFPHLIALRLLELVSHCYCCTLYPPGARSLPCFDTMDCLLCHCAPCLGMACLHSDTH
jgi:hypothetical protein